jgi:type IV pilus assembly protein PilE
MTRSRGFTLIELMIAIAIIAILAAIAIPSYSDYIRRSRITEAIATLSGMRVKMEQYYQDNRKYDGACAVPPAVTVANKPADTVNWTFTCSPAPAGNNYLITATGQGTMQGFQYTLDQDNNRTSTITAPSWTGNASCWAIKKDGSC